MLHGVVHVVSRDGSHSALFDPNGTAFLTPVWSPDGRLLAFDDERDGIELADIKAGTARLLTRDRASDISWAPDGRSLAYVVNLSQLSYERGDLRVVSLSGQVRTVVAAAGSYGGKISGEVWTRPPAGLRYPTPRPRSIATVSPDLLVALGPIERLAADGGRVAYVACGHVFAWTPATGEVVQAEPVASPSCVLPEYGNPDIYDLAVAGDRLAYAIRSGGCNSVRWSIHGTALAPTLQSFQLDMDDLGQACAGAYQHALGDLAGSGALLVLTAWQEKYDPYTGPVTTAQTIYRVGSDGCGCPAIRTEPGPLVPADVDGGRIVAYGTNSVVLLDASGAQLLSVPVVALGVALSGSDLVVRVSGALRDYDAGSGALLHAWPFPDAPGPLFCTGLHHCSNPRLVLEDAARGLAAYVLDGQVHLLRLADGADAVLAAGTLARFMDAGLVYTDGARIHLVPFEQLPLRAG